MITGDIFSACPHRQFHTLLVLLDSRLHCKTLTLTHACHAERLFVPHLFMSVVCTDQYANPRPTALYADTHTTTPFRCGNIFNVRSSCGFARHGIRVRNWEDMTPATKLLIECHQNE